MVPRTGIEPVRPFRDPGFSYPPRLSPPRNFWRVWSLDYPLTLACALGPARLVSTPSKSLVLAWLGIPSEGFPEFERFCSMGFSKGTQFFLSPVRLPISPPRHPGWSLTCTLPCRELAIEKVMSPYVDPIAASSQGGAKAPEAEINRHRAEQDQDPDVLGDKPDIPAFEHDVSQKPQVMRRADRYRRSIARRPACFRSETSGPKT